MAKAKTAKEKLRDVVKAHNAKVTNPKPKKLKKPTKAEQKRLAEKAAPKKAAVKIPKKKTCRTCKKTKVVKTKDGATNFWKNARSKDGLRDQCKDCFYDYRKAAQDAEDETDAG